MSASLLIFILAQDLFKNVVKQCNSISYDTDRQQTVNKVEHK